MRMFVRLVAAVLATLFITSPALSATTVIARLGSEPLFSTSSSLAELRKNLSQNNDRVATATDMLSLSPAEYRDFRAAIDRGRVRESILPRHLQAMSFYRDGRVHVVHDILIPTGTKGWEVDLEEPGQTARIIIPAICGNISIIREFHPAVAARVTVPHARVSSLMQRVLAP